MKEKIKQSITNAQRFLMNNRDHDGLWRDFDIRNYGILEDWITAYTGLALVRSGFSEFPLRHTADALSNRQKQKVGGWSCDERVVPDTDTTAFVIMFLSSFGYKDSINKGKDFIKRQQMPDGSFRTYQPDLIAPFIPGLTSEGWSGGIPEVTATASRALGGDKRGISYLERSALPNGGWREYWYNKDIYVNTQGIFSLEGISSAAKIVNDTRDKLLLSEHGDSPFYQSLIIAGNTTQSRMNLILGNIETLLDMQREDGSWESPSMLQFPLPPNIEPWNDQRRIREDLYDQKRIFTTSTCLMGLSNLRELNI